MCKALKPYQRNIAGLRNHVGLNDEDFQKVLANLENVASVGCGVFSEFPSISIGAAPSGKVRFPLGDELTPDLIGSVTERFATFQ